MLCKQVLTRSSKTLKAIKKLLGLLYYSKDAIRKYVVDLMKMDKFRLRISFKTHKSCFKLSTKKLTQAAQSIGILFTLLSNKSTSVLPTTRKKAKFRMFFLLIVQFKSIKYKP